MQRIRPQAKINGFNNITLVSVGPWREINGYGIKFISPGEDPFIKGTVRLNIDGGIA